MCPLLPLTYELPALLTLGQDTCLWCSSPSASYLSFSLVYGATAGLNIVCFSPCLLFGIWIVLEAVRGKPQGQAGEGGVQQQLDPQDWLSEAQAKKGTVEAAQSHWLAVCLGHFLHFFLGLSGECRVADSEDNLSFRPGPRQEVWEPVSVHRAEEKGGASR